MHETTAPAETTDTTQLTAVAEINGTSRPAPLETLPPPGPHQQPHALATPTLHPAPSPAPQPPAGAAAHPPAAYPASYQPWASPVPQTTSRPGLILGVISLVVSGLALLGVLGLTVWAFGDGHAGLPMEDMAPPPPLTGQLAPAGSGDAVSSDDLTAEITERMEQDGAWVEDMRCPGVPRVAQGVVSVCHSTMDDAEWAIIVFFEDSEGSYTLSLV